MKKEETPTTEATSTLEKKTLKLTTKTHLSVFSKKTIDPTQASRMRPGAEVILDFLTATAEDGDQLVRVRKDGSTRTFYTTSKHVEEVM
jgi:hypothetical protein